MRPQNREQPSREERANQYLKRLKGSPLHGRLKVYIGMSAGVGKTYRMLQEARNLLKSGENILVGYVETHGREETHSLLEGLPLVPRREVFYKGKRLEEFDLNAVLILKPQWVIVDELAHTNIPGSKNQKRYQDIVDLLHEGINVITAVNIQHIESITDEVRQITGVEISEKVPDSFIGLASEVVNIDLPADELVARLQAGKIYSSEKIEQALNNFFQPEKILQLRELALKEVASQVERKVANEVDRSMQFQHERFLVLISANPVSGPRLLRRAARFSAGLGNIPWYVIYIRLPNDAMAKMPLARQRELSNTMSLAIELGAQVLEIDASGQSGRHNTPNVRQSPVGQFREAVYAILEELSITAVFINRPHKYTWYSRFFPSLFTFALDLVNRYPINLHILGHDFENSK